MIEYLPNQPITALGDKKGIKTLKLNLATELTNFGATMVVRISIHIATTTQLTMVINSNNNKVHIKWDNNKCSSLVIPSDSRSEHSKGRV